jgi:ABC-type branched-subunit amino acid transport system substrate-binding protein
MRRAFSFRFTLPSFARGLCAAGALLGSLGALAAGCSLGNLAHDDCTTDAECSSAFGVGSVCTEGFCSDAATCNTGHDCRKIAGGGACVSGACQATFPTDSACSTIVEPPDLLDGPALGDDAPIVIGGIFSLDEPKNAALTVAVRLAVQDINRTGGMTKGKKLGIVFCDNGGPKNTASGADRTARNNHALDYLAGTLGAPVIIGPLTSADSIQLINHVKEKLYPTVIISPSATSPDLTGVDDRLHIKDPYGLFWRTCPSDVLQGEVLAKQMPEMATKVAVVYIKDSYGEGLSAVFRDVYDPDFNNTKPYAIEAADLGNADKLEALATEMVGYAPDAVVLITTTGGDTVNLLKAMAGKPFADKPFFFTDGAKDSTSLLDANLPAGVLTIIKKAIGTAPASPSGKNYATLEINLTAAGLTPSSFSFLAQSYDATMVGAFGIIAASTNGTNYDGLDVAAGLTKLSAGTQINLNPTSWLSGVGELRSAGHIDVVGTSGDLQFDPKTGEAPAPIEIWGVESDLSAFTHIMTVNNP